MRNSESLYKRQDSFLDYLELRKRVPPTKPDADQLVTIAKRSGTNNICMAS